MNNPIPIERRRLTPDLVRSMRLAVAKTSYQLGGTEYMIQRPHLVRNPHVWWYTCEHWQLSIHCRHNAHGEYHLELSPGATPEDGIPRDWFCFLKNGQHSNTYLHLRHVVYFDELQLIVRALTDMELCESEGAAHAWLDQHPNPKPDGK